MGNAGICSFLYCSYLSHVMNSLKVCNILLQDWYFFAKSSTTNSHVNMRWYHCSNYYTITSQCQNQPYMVLQQLMLESRSYTDSILQCWHRQQYLIPTFLTSYSLLLHMRGALISNFYLNCTIFTTNVEIERSWFNNNEIKIIIKS